MNSLRASDRFSRLALSAGQYRWFALGMVLLAIYGNFIPFHFESRTFAEAQDHFWNMPFFDASDLGARGDWVVSLALFAAVSFLLMASLCVDRSSWVGLPAGVAVVAFCAALSVLIEFGQIFFPPRTVSLNDIVLESIGGLVGTLAWLAFGQRLTLRIRELLGEPNLAGLAARLLPCYLALVLIVELVPFDIVLSGRELTIKYDEGRILLVPFKYGLMTDPMAWLGKALTTMGIFFPAGFFWALVRKDPQSPPRTLDAALLFGVGITTLVELLKLFMYSRYCDTTGIVTGTLAVLAGWKAATWLEATLAKSPLGSGARPQTPAWTIAMPLLFVSWFAFVAYCNWRPFNFTTDPDLHPSSLIPHPSLPWVSWLPLVEYYWGSKYQLIDQFVSKSLAFAPLGILMSLALHASYRPASAWPAVLAALVAAVIMQIGRYYLPARVPSLTDVGLSCVGAYFGFKVFHHFRGILWAERTLFGYMRGPPAAGLSNGKRIHVNFS